ncbi:MAG: hypothetical protein K2X81_06805, partial [Candidatus Obscuribacterales bacterium]|nr:hypothetical protein [Candidatus Obscuribacterales bacterium]
MQALGEGLGKKRDANNRPAFLDGLGVFEKLPAALVFGALLGLSSPGFDLWWVAWIGLVPLFVLLRSCRSFFDASLTGFAFGFAYHLVSHRWILELYPLTLIQIHDWLGLLAVWVMWFLEAAHQAILFAIFGFMAYALPTRAGLLPHYKRPFFPFVFALPPIWVFLQWTIGPSEPFFGIPVNQLAYSQAGVLPVMQVCSLGGCQLLEFLIVMVNAAAAETFFEFFPWLVTPLPDRIDHLSAKGGGALDLAIILALVLAAAGWGEW